MSEKCSAEVMDRYLQNNSMFCFEGDRGVKHLNTLCKDLGYAEQLYRYGSSLELFLSDNPGACQELICWITEQLNRNSEWRDALSIEEDKDIPIHGDSCPECDGGIMVDTHPDGMGGALVCSSPSCEYKVEECNRVDLNNRVDTNI